MIEEQRLTEDRNLKPEKVSIILARALSAIFHPLLMPTILFSILLFRAPAVLGVDTFTATFRLSLLMLIGISTFLVPAFLIYFMHRMGHVRSLHMDELRDRRLPYFLTALLYTTTTLLFTFRLSPLSDIAPEIGIVLGSVTVSVTLVGLISLFWKISAHSVGISGMVGVLFGIAVKYSELTLLYPLLLLIILAGLLASARLHLNAHTPTQVAAGMALGLVVSLLTVVLMI
ncbi:hypothetical protein LX87_03548 [Larkinella arboricola]|uniref:Phosphatidic acid phosphatase type 2/haloperoxidase domain-containing protein n=1 Tax=Larkinella arboricola TaxID=643671 RepID=A0A327X0S6_LARAB|nr:hypothetical protein [Larkinella arboricola]RAJ95799.1 hypothetical protein LX87_03548 [Larkinella arboricola]